MSEKEEERYDCTNKEIKTMVDKLPYKMRKKMLIVFIIFILIIVVNIFRNKIQLDKSRKKFRVEEQYKKIKREYDSIKRVSQEENLKRLEEERNIFLKKFDSLETVMIDSLGCDCPNLVTIGDSI